MLKTPGEPALVAWVSPPGGPHYLLQGFCPSLFSLVSHLDWGLKKEGSARSGPLKRA